MIYAIGSLGGFLGPTVFGVARQQTGSYVPAMAALAVGLALAAVLVLAIGRSKRLALAA
jgi:nitrate/nitrite transporter NarK